MVWVTVLASDVELVCSRVLKSFSVRRGKSCLARIKPERTDSFDIIHTFDEPIKDTIAFLILAAVQVVYVHVCSTKKAKKSSLLSH